jgi:hypothetical protein
MTSRSRDALRHRAAAASVILRCERSEPRRTTARTPRPHPSRAASRPPQDDGSEVSTIILAARLSARAMPSHALKSPPPDIARSQNGVVRTPTPVVHAKLKPQNAGGSICKRHFGNDEWKKRDERTKKSEAERRQRLSRLLPRHSGPGRAPNARRTSIGVPPRFSPQGVFHRKGLSTKPGFLGRGGQWSVLCAGVTRPACPEVQRAPRTPVIVPRD